MQPSNQQTQAVSTNQQTQQLNQQMQSLNQQIQPVNQQMQPVNQQMQQVNQQIQPVNQQTQAVLTNQQMQPINQQMKPVNQQMQPVNQQMQQVNQQIQPVNQQTQTVSTNQQMQTSNQQTQVMSKNQQIQPVNQQNLMQALNQQIQQVNQQTQAVSPKQQIQPSNKQTQAVSPNQQMQSLNQQTQTVSTNQPNHLEALVSQQLLAQILGKQGLGTLILPTLNPIPPMAAGEIEIAPPITLPTTVSPLSTINITSQGFDLPLQRQQQDQQLNLANNLPLEVSGNSSLSPVETGVTQANSSVMQGESTVLPTTVTTKDNLVIRLNETSKGIRLIPDGRGGVRIINLRAAASTETPWIESGTSNSTVITGTEPLHRLALLHPTNETLRKLEISDRLNTTDIPEEIELPNGTSLDGPGPTPAMNSVYTIKLTTLTPASAATIKPATSTTIKPAAPTTVEQEETTTPIDLSEMDFEAEEGMSTTSTEVDPTTTTIAQNATMILTNSKTSTVKPNTITTTTATTVTVKPTTITTTTAKPTTITTTTAKPTTIKTTTIRPTTLKPPTTQFTPIITPQTFIQSALGWLSPFSTTPAADIIAYGGFLNMADPYMQTKAHEPALYDILNEVMLGKLKGRK
ncbi:mucin-2-like [Mytilus californianus]|uniref:mucin-2-like n=1 Tax=Mytilus californianus TaxID=6549 RepID=UPI00224627BA|nr:mucin-2-like [Mytilus californianus]